MRVLCNYRMPKASNKTVEEVLLSSSSGDDSPKPPPKGLKRCSKKKCFRFMNLQDPHSMCRSCQPAVCTRDNTCEECLSLPADKLDFLEVAQAKNQACREKRRRRSADR
jgi:hypothetical protein